MSTIYKIPTHSPEKGWHYSIFQSKQEFREYLKTLFKEPGQYKFDKTVELFNEHARMFMKKKLFCEAPEGSRDYYKYWDTEREKCRRGVIFKNDKGDEWYLPRFYYHWVNFLQIYNKNHKKFEFPDVRDVQYHIAMYEMLAELHGKNIVGLKKRQIAWSYFHVARQYNKYIFESGFVGKLMASDKKYINATHGSWKFLEEYHNFTNTHTAWACNNMPHKEFAWQQKVEQKTVDGRKTSLGTKATISGITLDKDPISGVGGAADEVDYEEGGIAPTADVTYGYMRDAMREGAIITGIFIIGGSVGDLEQCEPLRTFLLDPEPYDFYPVKTNLLDENGTEGVSGLFIPEQWSMPGDTEETNCIDEFGNSLVQKALDYLDKHYKNLKQKLKPEDYQLRVSQGPRNIAEAFAIRKTSPFPVRYTAPQIKRIEDKEYYLEYVDLERTDKDTIEYRPSDRQPMVYPTDMKMEDKRGCGVMHERPIHNTDAGWLYLASVDPVETGDTNNSESLAAIYVYKLPVEVAKEDGDTVETFIEKGSLVFEWVGRYSDPTDTNEQLSKVVEFYQAYTQCEKNKPGFISYMMLKKRQRYLAKAKDMIFDKEYESTDDTFKAYGYTATPALWKKFLQYGIDSLAEELGPKKKPDGTIERIIYGVERIPFIWLLKEMQQYQDKKNFDRVIAYCALMAFVAAHLAIVGHRRKVQRSSQKATNTEELRILLERRSIRIGTQGSRPSQYNITRKAFKHLH